MTKESFTEEDKIEIRKLYQNKGSIHSYFHVHETLQKEFNPIKKAFNEKLRSGQKMETEDKILYRKKKHEFHQNWVHLILW